MLIEEGRHYAPLQAKGNPLKKHFIMLTGGDNRAWCIKRTLPLVKKFFDTVTVTDIGSTDDTREVCLANGVNYIRKTGHPNMPLSHMDALNRIPTNEWVYFADSDECPSYCLLKSLDHLVAQAAACNIAKYKLPIGSHYFDAKGVLGGGIKHLNKGDHRSMCLEHVCWGAYRFIQKRDDFAIITTDTHYVFDCSGPHVFMPLVWNHYKGVKSAAKSAFILALAYPDTHYLKGTKEGDDWAPLRKKYGFSVDVGAQWANQKKLPDDVMELIDSWSTSHHHGAAIIRDCVFKYDFDGEEPKCTAPCCDYFELQEILA